jgi:hypothetical protein
MNESMPSSAQPAHAAQKPRIWFGVRRDLGEAGKVSFYRAGDVKFLAGRSKQIS